MLICTRFSFATIEPTVDEFGEEVFEDFKDNQGQATQGKPSILVAYLDPSFTYASFFMFYAKCIVFNCYYPFIAIYWRLGSTSQLLSSIWMTSSRHLLIPWFLWLGG
jgi:hypothetical protein